MKPTQNVVITVVLVIGALMAIALFKGFDGTLLTIVVGVLAALGGKVLPQTKVV